MTDQPKPSEERGETFREAASIIAGMLACPDLYTPNEIVGMLLDQADANDILMHSAEKEN